MRWVVPIRPQQEDQETWATQAGIPDGYSLPEDLVSGPLSVLDSY